LNQIIKTSDGSHTIYVPELDEHYHSVNGAIKESEYIFINCGLGYCRSDPVRIFEAGFGTGLNALLTYVNAIAQNRKIFYTAIEKNPLPGSITDSLNYKDFVGTEYRPIFEQLHSCNWNLPIRINTNFTLLKLKADLTADILQGKYDLIYFDAFGPDKQPEMWTEDVFKKIAIITDSNGILVTYSAKVSVQRILKKNGFEVDLLPGPPGKRQIIRAVKI
jgi:tRNA U34 5-methylaminomethyl-2-thiouridine-forming methyltransferase MnmC